MRRATLLTAFLCLLAQPVAADDGAWQALAQPRTHALMRHAIAPGTGDPPGFRLGDCATQRNLDERGRAQARAVGEAFRRRGVTVDRVLTSRWCRASETAQLVGLGEAREEPALDSFFAERTEGPNRTAALKTLLAALPEDENALLVTHQVNITALTGIVPASGEIVVITLTPEGEARVRGRIAADGG